MTSYFDHFILIKLTHYLVTDVFFIFGFIIIIWFILLRFFTVIPFRTQIIINILFKHWLDLVKENLGNKYRYYSFPLLLLFITLLSLNLLGFYLYTFPSTTHINLTFGIAFSCWMTIIFLGFSKYGFSFMSAFMPNGAPLGLSPLLVPIEILSNVSRPIALGMRLAANLTAGHILLAILADFGAQILISSPGVVGIFPFLIVIFMTILEIGVLIIQAYVFCLLLLIYLKDSLELH